MAKSAPRQHRQEHISRHTALRKQVDLVDRSTAGSNPGSFGGRFVDGCLFRGRASTQWRIATTVPRTRLSPEDPTGY